MRFCHLFWFVLLAAGCSSTPGAKPHDMSAAAHDRSAANEREAGAAHAAQYDSAADRVADHCGSGSVGSVNEICWSSTTNPTEAHRIASDRHRKAAADHRAASEALRDAEARACSGILPEDRDMSPFAHRDDILSVEPLSEAPGPKSAIRRLTGAAVTFRALPGASVDSLQRLVDCHIARASALGHDMPEMSYCPLVPKGVSAHVTSAGDVLTVAIRGEDAAAADEVLRRARRLTSP